MTLSRFTVCSNEKQMVERCNFLGRLSGPLEDQNRNIKNFGRGNFSGECNEIPLLSFTKSTKSRFLRCLVIFNTILRWSIFEKKFIFHALQHVFWTFKNKFFKKIVSDLIFFFVQIWKNIWSQNCDFFEIMEIGKILLLTIFSVIFGILKIPSMNDSRVTFC